MDERRYNFPVFGTQGGGLVREVRGVYIFVTKPECPGLDVGDEMPTEWSIAAANDLATEQDAERTGLSVPKTRSNKPTVCTSCRNFTNKEPGSVRADCWYNHFCRATPLPTAIDPFDGKTKPCSRNDLGKPIFTSNPFAFCRDINTGNCPKFQTESSASN